MIFTKLICKLRSDGAAAAHLTAHARENLRQLVTGLWHGLYAAADGYDRIVGGGCVVVVAAAAVQQHHTNNNNITTTTTPAM